MLQGLLKPMIYYNIINIYQVNYYYIISWRESEVL